MKSTIFKWTADRDDILRELYPTTPSTEIAKMLGCTYRAVQTHAQSLGIRKRPVYRKLDEKQILWLKINLPHITDSCAAALINVPLHTIKYYSRKLKIKKTEQATHEIQTWVGKQSAKSEAHRARWPKKGQCGFKKKDINQPNNESN